MMQTEISWQKKKKKREQVKQMVTAFHVVTVLTCFAVDERLQIYT
jgi:hypothetical protein